MIGYNYNQTSRSRSRGRETVLLIVLIVGLVGAGLYGRQWMPYLTDLLQPVLAHLTGWSSGLGAVADKVENIQNLSEKVKTLSAENQQLQEQLQLFTITQTENERLKQLLAISTPPNYRSLSARVISRSPDHWFERLYISAGSSQGITLNSVVVNSLGVVGKVLDMTQNTALVTLISDPASAVGCVTENGRSPAILEGLHQENGKLKYLQNYAQVKPGEKIYTSGLGGVFPPNLVLGTVEQVEKASNHPVPEVHIRLTALQQALEEVLVLIPESSALAVTEEIEHSTKKK